MKRTNEELVELAGQLERGEFQPVKLDRAEDLRAIADAADATVWDEARLCKAVEVARFRGRSWSRIGLALGVSEQTARQRFKRLIVTK
jgi:hypothetical protein